MKKSLFTACLLMASAIQAQVLYVNNTDGTYMAVDTKLNKEVTFDAEQLLVRFTMDDGTESSFSTEKIKNIAPSSNQGTELLYDLNPKIAFDAADENGYSEIVETIITDELDDESGDFVENYKPERTITITFSETGVKTSSLPSDITAAIEGGHIVINSARSKVAYRVTGKCSNRCCYRRR